MTTVHGFDRGIHCVPRPTVHGLLRVRCQIGNGEGFLNSKESRGIDPIIGSRWVMFVFDGDESKLVALSGAGSEVD